jgi:hypothetical protein
MVDRTSQIGSGFLFHSAPKAELFGPEGANRVRGGSIRGIPDYSGTSRLRVTRHLHPGDELSSRPPLIQSKLIYNAGVASASSSPSNSTASRFRFASMRLQYMVT